jgi:Na+/H+ antiporter NhaA
MTIISVWRQSRALAYITLVLFGLMIAGLIAALLRRPTITESVLYGIVVGMIVGIMLASQILGPIHGSDRDTGPAVR